MNKITNLEIKTTFYIVLVLCLTILLCVGIVTETIYKIQKLEYQQNQNHDLSYCYNIQKNNDCTGSLFFWDNGEVRCFVDFTQSMKILGFWK